MSGLLCCYFEHISLPACAPVVDWGLEQPGALVWLLLQANWTLCGALVLEKECDCPRGFSAASINRLDCLLMPNCGAGAGMVGALLLLVWAVWPIHRILVLEQGMGFPTGSRLSFAFPGPLELFRANADWCFWVLGLSDA